MKYTHIFYLFVDERLKQRILSQAFVTLAIFCTSSVCSLPAKNVAYHAGMVGAATAGAAGLTYAVKTAYDMYAQGNTLLDTVDAVLEGSVVEPQDDSDVEKTTTFLSRLKNSVKKVGARMVKSVRKVAPVRNALEQKQEEIQQYKHNLTLTSLALLGIAVIPAYAFWLSMIVDHSSKLLGK